MQAPMVVSGRLSRRAVVGGLAGLGASAAALVLVGGCGMRSVPKLARVGFLSAGEATSGGPEAFRGGLRDAGWVEDQNLTIEWRYAEGHNELLAGFATQLVRFPVDVIVVDNSASAAAAKQATASIPIVMASSADPVALGLVDSLARPGGNITGNTGYSPQLSAKKLQLLKEIVPALARVAVMWNPNNPGNRLQLGEVQAGAATLGLAVQPIEARVPEELQPALDSAVRQGSGGVIVVSDTLFTVYRAELTDLVAASSLPAVYALRVFVTTGGLLSYGPSATDQFRRAGAYVDRILRGAEPSALPIEQPATFQFVFNLQTAQALGLTIPPDVAAQVTEWVE
jgi:putative tryptophan/tyrosine transport system substrate-binding protein